MLTVAKPDVTTDALNAPTLNDKTMLITKMAESKVSLDANAVPVCSVPHPHAAHNRLSVRCLRVAKGNPAQCVAVLWSLRSA